MSESEVDYDEFLELVEDDELEEVREILEENPAAANIGNPGDDRPLHKAVSAEMAKLLLDHGAEVDARCYDNMTPLINCAKVGKVAPAAVLIAAGADVNAIDEHDYTVLAWATVNPFAEEMVPVLLKAGANYDLTAAATWGDLARVEEIFSDDPEATLQVPSTEVLIAGIAVRDRGPREDRIRILDRIMAHRPSLKIAGDELDKHIAWMEESNMGDFRDVLSKHRQDYP